MGNKTQLCIELHQLRSLITDNSIRLDIEDKFASQYFSNKCQEDKELDGSFLQHRTYDLQYMG